MRRVTSPAAMQRLALGWRRRGERVALVPTMGYLHDGHLSLIRRARRAVGSSGLVVLSIYVNPAQFGPQEDWQKYPRDLKGDLRRCRAAGVDLVFAPADAAIYPTAAGDKPSTWVVEDQLSLGMEGESRPGHFRGVTTIVLKLLNLVLPNVAVFGAKDCQQASVVQRMVRDLNIPVKILVAPTCREPDGLAMSSRNKYLVGNLRQQATVLWHALQLAGQRVRSAYRPPAAAVLKKQLKRRIERQPDARVDYIEFFHPETLQPVKMVAGGTRMALAVFIGRTRLIDNARL